jgi:hypothetical protein
MLAWYLFDRLFSNLLEVFEHKFDWKLNIWLLLKEHAVFNRQIQQRFTRIKVPFIINWSALKRPRSMYSCCNSRLALTKLVNVLLPRDQKGRLRCLEHFLSLLDPSKLFTVITFSLCLWYLLGLKFGFLRALDWCTLSPIHVKRLFFNYAFLLWLRCRRIFFLAFCRLRLILAALSIQHIKDRAQTFFNLDHLRWNHVPDWSHLLHKLQAFFLLLANVVVDTLLHRFFRFGKPGQSVWVLLHDAFETRKNF